MCVKSGVVIDCVGPVSYLTMTVYFHKLEMLCPQKLIHYINM